ncbi:MAG: AAA family ATPase [Candidatus Dormibacteria bacterium]
MEMRNRVLCPVIVDRHAPLAALEDALFQALQGEGQVICVSGEAGVGKTRLLAEVMAQARKLGAQVLTGGCSETTISLPYLPFLEAVGNHLGGADPTYLREAVGPAAADLAQLFPQFADVGARPDEPMQAKLRLFEGILTLMDAIGGDRGTVLVIEDVHWADASTREMLDYMARRLRNSRVLLACSYRGDELHRRHPLIPIIQGWTRAGLGSIVPLEPLEPAYVDEMVDAIFETDRIAPEIKAVLFSRCDGNPYVLEEILKEAVDRRRGAAGSPMPSGLVLTNLRVPRSVAETVLVRLHRLDPEQAEVLRVASVLGRSFDFHTLSALVDAPAGEILEAVREGVSEQILEEEGRGGRYRFRHALTREAIYDDLLDPDRQDLHLRAATVLGQKPGSSAVDVAHHFLASGRWGEAVPACIAGGDEAMRRLGAHEALDLYQRALQLIADQGQRAEVLARCGRAAWFAGEVKTARRYLEEAVLLLEAAAPERAAAVARITLGEVYFSLGLRADANDQWELACAVLDGESPSEDLARAYALRAQAVHYRLDLESAESLVHRALEVAELAGARDAGAVARVNEGFLRVERGDVEKGLGILDRALRDAAGTSGEGYALWRSALATIWTVRLDRMPALVARLRALVGYPRRSFETGFLDHAYLFFSGRVQEAELKVMENKAEAERTGMGSWWVDDAMTIIMTERDELSQAAEAMPVREADPMVGAWQRWEELTGSETVMRLELARGTPAQAVPAAHSILYSGDLPYRLAPALPVAAEVLLAVDDVEAARQLVEFYAGRDHWKKCPWLWLAEALILEHRQGFPAALARAADAAAEFRSGGMILDAWRCELVVARTQAAAGRPELAATALNRLLAEVEANGAQLLARRVKETARAAGLQEPISEAGDAPRRSDPIRLGAGATEQLVTVLFADVRGYTAMTARENPYEMADLMAGFYRAARREVERRHGYVDEFRGDSVMATFNITSKRLDHCLGAFRAAVALQQRAQMMNLPLGIGIAVGPAIVGEMTDDNRITVIGDPANLAARLQVAAGEGEIIVSSSAHQRIRQWAAEKGHGFEPRTLDLKGLGDAVEAFVTTPGRRPGHHQSTTSAVAEIPGETGGGQLDR